MQRLVAAVTLLALTAPVEGAAAIYRWSDDKGVVHFTDNPDRIPMKHLGRAQEIESANEAAPTAPATKGAAPAAVAPAAAPAAPAAVADKAATGEKAKLAAELEKLREGLEQKRKELDRLQHKWTVAKGRTPTEKEIEEFEKKRAEGKATFKDNPYVNKKPLSNPAPARAAYYAKLEEIRRDEAKVQELEQQLNGIGR